MGVRGIPNDRFEVSEVLTIEEGGEGPEEALRPHAPCLTGKSARAQCALQVPRIDGAQKPTAVWKLDVVRECVHDSFAELEGKDAGLHGGRGKDLLWRDSGDTGPYIGGMFDELAEVMAKPGGGGSKWTYTMLEESLSGSMDARSRRARNEEQFEWPRRTYSCVRRKQPRGGTCMSASLPLIQASPIHFDLVHRNITSHDGQGKLP